MNDANAYLTSTGPSRPAENSEVPPLRPELVETLARLLAEAIVADIPQFPNLAELHAKQESTVESPSGPNRRKRSANGPATPKPWALASKPPPVAA